MLLYNANMSGIAKHNIKRRLPDIELLQTELVQFYIRRGLPVSGEYDYFRHCHVDSGLATTVAIR